MNYTMWSFQVSKGHLGQNLSLPFQCAKNIFCKSSLGFQGTVSRVVNFQSTEVNIIQGCIVNGENKNHFTSIF